ncbi:VWA domain-containing protein [Zobellia roscoffensis]|uniref:VWA domain-containing protein n=1 Tax=Zobellia roscoffensis TaxID=2779508 RepID=UPI00188A7DA4|nr:VWA domain-containing protein [Zobellia roscoffensis]
MTSLENYFVRVIFYFFVFLSTIQNLIGGTGNIDASGRMNFSINYRYPPTSAEITFLKSQLQIANDFICNMTEGQIRFGDVRITSGGSGEAEADIWILAQDGRSGVSFYLNGSSFGTLGNHIVLYQGGIRGDVIAHELGHLAFGLGDEYGEQRRWKSRCGIGPCFDGGTMDAVNNCMMQQGSFQTELCTNANHDNTVGDVDCSIPTETVDFEIVLSTAETNETFDSTSFETAKSSSNFLEKVEIFDDRGDLSGDETRILHYYFVRNAMSDWQIHVGIDGKNFDGGIAGDLTMLGNFNLTFNPMTGELTTISPLSATINLNNLNSGSPNQTITLNFGTIGTSNGISEGTPPAGNCRNEPSCVAKISSVAYPLCGNCERNWNSTNLRYERSQQTFMHNESCWQTLIDNYGSRVSGLTEPIALSSTLPSTCAGMNIIDNGLEGADQVMLFIDRSGSMDMRIDPDNNDSPIRLDFAKAAARAYVDLRADAAGSSMVGLVSFEQTPSLDRGITNLTSGIDANGFKDDIDLLVADGRTGIGTAITASFFSFDGVEAAGRNRAAFLLSDGENNEGTDPEIAAQQLRDRDVRIFTIPVGNAADRSLLSEIASTSGGVMLDAPTGDELPSIYLELMALSSGESLVLPRTPSAVRGRFGNEVQYQKRNDNTTNRRSLTQNLVEVDSLAFNVEIGSEKLNLFLSARNSNINTWSPNIEVIAPNGTVYNNSNNSINVIVDPYYTILKFDAPIPGTWRMNISSRNAFDQLSFVAAHVQNDKPDLYVDALPKVVKATDIVTISAKASFVSDLDETTVYTGVVRRPDKTVVPINFMYDPEGRSMTANFNDYVGKGVYEIRVFAEPKEDTNFMPGESIFTGPETPSIDLELFERYATTSFYLDVPNLPPCHNQDCDNDGIPNDQESNEDEDNDGRPDYYDDDSDGDDIPDSQEDDKKDSNKRKGQLGFHVGMTAPLSKALDRGSDANIYAALDYNYNLNDNYDLKLQAGIMQLTSEIAPAQEHPRWYFITANLEAALSRPGHIWKPYVSAGPGVYFPKNGSTGFGANIGVGIKSALFRETQLDVGLNYHLMSGEVTNQLVALHIGFRFK